MDKETAFFIRTLYIYLGRYAAREVARSRRIFTGTKLSPFGRTDANWNTVSRQGYGAARTFIVTRTELSSSSGVALMKWVKARLDDYYGEFRKSSYPKILFGWTNGCGVEFILDRLQRKSQRSSSNVRKSRQKSMYLLGKIYRYLLGDAFSVLDVTPRYGIFWHLLENLRLRWVSLFAR
jgi:hypothetical protein